MIRSRPATSTLARLGATSGKLRNVWMLSYEYSGIAQAGGLGEAVTGLARTLASDYELNVTVFMPAHGRHLEPSIARQFNLDEVSTFVASGYRTGINGVRYSFLSGAEVGIDQKVNVFLAKGLDDPTSHWLDDLVLYESDLTFEKMALFSRTMATYSEYLLAMGRKTELPDLIHANDWHMVPAGVAVKQHLQEAGVKVPLVFTVHLLSRVTLPWHYASEDWSGIRNQNHPVGIAGDRSVPLTYKQVWEDNAGGSIEKFGAIEADYVTSVSQSYLVSDVRDYVGDVVTGKSGHIYNGCDWDYERIRSSAVSKEAGASIQRPEYPPLRSDLRKSLLLKDLAELDADESSSFTFQSDGPLVLMTGRLSPQKGVDLLLESVPTVVEEIPDAKFLLFLLPSNDSALTDEVVTKAASHPDNVRLFFGKSPSVYHLSHIAADVYAMPSRSEPFGISALEAMVTGNPVVGTNLGGISETVLDIVRHGATGTGILVPPENVEKLASSLVSLLLAMKINEQQDKGRPDPAHLWERIPIEPISEMVSRNPNLGARIRANCRARVEQNFRWKNAGRTAMERYTIAQTIVSRSETRSGGSLVFQEQNTQRRQRKSD